MAVLFSAVTVIAGEDQTELLVGGIPREYDDLESWSKFIDFLQDIEEEAEVLVHAEAYLYGNGETVNATPEEVAYFIMRMEMQADFLQNHCDNIEDVDFSFTWSPEELFEMEMN